MTRSVGVTIAAVVAIIGSVFSLLCGLFTLLGTLLQSVTTPATPFLKYSLFITSALLLGLAAWGIATAIGLFRLHRWARTSILVFSGLLIFFGAISALFIVFIPIPVPENVPHQFMVGVRIGVAMFYLLWVAVGLWWLYLFNKAAVKKQFLGDLPATDRSPKPLSITVIAWFLLVGGILMPFWALLRMPAAVFGLILMGWKGSLVCMIYAAAGLYLGVGLLKLKPLSRTLAVYFFLFGILNSLLFAVLPGRAARMAASINLLPPEMRSPDAVALVATSWWFTLVMPLICMGVPLWFLITRKKAFLAAGKPPAIVP